MAMLIEIKKKMPGFSLDVSYEGLAVKTGILGAPGAGKSLLLKCIAGLERPDEGRIQIDGHTVYDSGRKVNMKVQKRRIGYLTSEYALFPGMSVENNILCGYRGRKSQGEGIVSEYIRKFGLTGLEDQMPERLTDMAKQRTAMARALIGEPLQIVFDEPFLGKEGYQKEDLQADFYRYLKDYEGGCVLASQNPEDIYEFCDHVVVLGKGSVIASGAVKDIYKNPVSMEVARLTGCRNFSRIEILDEYHVLALDWGIALRTEKRVTEDQRYVGIRKDQLKMVSGPGQNCIQVQILAKRYGMHMMKYEGKNAQTENMDSLIWEAKEESESMAYLYFPPENLMLLK